MPAEPAPASAPATATGDCLACRGTGQVVSHLGGEEQLVACPWCEGSGLRLVGHDAQARWRASAATSGAGGEARAA